MRSPRLRRHAPLALGLLLMVAGARASEYRETHDFADAVTAVAGYVDRYGAENTWLVIDIDNTLLAMQGDLGSDQWFEWQEYLLAEEPGSPLLVAKDFDGLVEVQGLLFTLGSMRTPQPNLPELVKQVQDRGVASLVITSRGPGFRAATERELTANGYDFAGHAPSFEGVPEGVFFPYASSRPAEAGLTPDEVKAFALGEPREASLDGGIYMTSGQHKGAMLLTAIHRAKHKPKAIVFVDDHGRHVYRVYDALNRRGIESTVMLYRAEDDDVARFRYGDKGDVTERWRVLKKALDQVFDLAPAPKAPTERAAALAAP